MNSPRLTKATRTRTPKSLKVITNDKKKRENPGNPSSHKNTRINPKTSKQTFLIYEHLRLISGVKTTVCDVKDMIFMWPDKPSAACKPVLMMVQIAE